MKQFRRLAAWALAAALLWNTGVPGFALDTEEETIPETVVEETAEAAAPEESIALEETEPGQESKLPMNLPGMPEGYTLSEVQLQEKRALAEHHVSRTLAGMTEGVDYEPGVVLFSAETEGYAHMVAEAYDAELLRWEYGVGIMALRSLTVLEAVKLAEDPLVPLPAVNANAIVSLEPVAELPSSGAQTMGLVPEAPTWSVWIHELLDNPDEYLSDPADSMYQWHHDAIDTYAAWGVTMGDPNIRVAVIDTGVDTANRDLREIQTVDIDRGTEDVYGHGSHVAGIIAASVDNGWFGAGIAPYVTVYSIRASGSGGSFSYADIIRAIYEAMDLDVHLINMSLGGVLYDFMLESAIRQAWNQGITIIVAAGNDGTNLLNYPAAFDTVISVGASDKMGNRAYFSNYGSRVDVLAPGYQIPSTYLYGSAAKLNGTSMACPVVTGAAALYMSKHYQTSGRIPAPETVRMALHNAASGGVLNAGRLFSGVRTAPVITVVNEAGIPVFGSSRTVTTDGTLTIQQEDTNDSVILYTLDGKTPAVKDGEIVNGQVYSGPIALDTLEPGSYPVRAASLNSSGVLSTAAKITLKLLPGNHPDAVVPAAPERIIAGKSVTLTAQVLPQTVSQSVRWEMVEELPGAAITKDGKLTTQAGQTGKLVVRAVSLADESVFQDSAILVENGTPAASVVLNEKTASLRVSNGNAQTFRLVPRALDGQKQLMDADTVAFSFSSSNPKAASVSADGLVTAKAPGTATITVKALDGSGKSAVCRITVRAGLERMHISGQLGIAPGASGSYQIVTVPQKVTGLQTSWQLLGAPTDVSISAKGVVKVGAKVPVGQTFGVHARVSDGWVSYEETRWVTVSPKATAVHVYQGGRDMPIDSVQNRQGFLTSAQIYSTDLLEDRQTDASGMLYTYRTNRLQLEAEAVGSLIVPGWSSSNPAVASVDEDGMVTGHRAGTAKITCKAQDGSGKTAVVTVKVINPASSIYVDSAAARVDKVDTRFLGYGKSVVNTPVLGTAYGTPSVKTVKWSVTARARDVMSGEMEDVTRQLTEEKLLTITQSGKLTIKAGAEAVLSGKQLFLTVSASTTDGSDLTDTLDYVVSRMATEVYSLDGVTSVYMFTNTSQSHGIFMDCDYQLFTVKSSNPDVAGAYLKQDSVTGYWNLVIVSGTHTGSAKITVTAADGSNRKLTVSVKVG